jgi:uncharacterized protein YdaU (DUF1376 family)
VAPEKSPAFQFYPKEFLTDGNVAAMSLQERGAYITLLCICWQEKSLPADLSRLANIVGVPLKVFTRLWPILSGCFIKQGDRFLHPRLEKEREKQTAFSRRQKDKADTRWKPEPCRTDAAAHAEPVPEPCSPISDLQSPISKERKTHTPAREPVALAGMLPRDHLKHGWCSSRGKCVPEFLHFEFIASVGGDRKGADQRLRAFYEAVEAGWPDGPIGDDPVKLWRKEFAAKFPSVAPVDPRTGRTEMLMTATREFLK